MDFGLAGISFSCALSRVPIFHCLLIDCTTSGGWEKSMTMGLNDTVEEVMRLYDFLLLGSPVLGFGFDLSVSGQSIEAVYYAIHTMRYIRYEHDV